MKKYFLIRAETDSSVIGVDNFEVQAKILREKYNNKTDYDDLISTLGSNDYWKHRESLSSSSVKLETAYVDAPAKITDLMRFSPALLNCQFMVSNKIKKLIETFCTDGIIFFDLLVVSGENGYDFSVMHVERLVDEVFNYENSVFFAGSELLGKQYLSFSSASEMEEYSLNNYDLDIELAYLDIHNSFNKHIFALTTGQIFISEELKMAFEQCFASGVIVLPAYDKPEGWPRIIVS